MIASLNMNGLRSHLYKVQLLMRELGIQILPLNESKLDPGYPKEITSVAGCQQERLDRLAMVIVFLFMSGTLSRSNVA